MSTIKTGRSISPTISARLKLTLGTLVSYHPQATSEFAKRQGYVVARVEPTYLDSYGKLFERAPTLLARALDVLTDGDAQGEREEIITDIKAALGLQQDGPPR